MPHTSTSNKAGRVASAIFMLLLTSVYLLAIGSCIQLAEKGKHLDWAFGVWVAVIGGTIVGLVDYTLLRFVLLSPSTDDSVEEASADTAPFSITLHTEIVVPPQTRRPFLRRNEQLMLVGAVAAGLIGGLLAVLFLKKRDERS